MTLVSDEHVLAPALVAQHAPAIRRLVPDAMVESDGHDLRIETRMSTIDAETGHALARMLRGGRDHDAARPADWHLRSMDRDETSGTTSLCISRSYRLPPGHHDQSGGIA